MKHCIAGAIMWGVLCLPAAAVAQPVLQERCLADSLNATQARARVEWARTCALTRNVGNPNNWFIANPYDVEMGFPAMYEYSEATYYWRAYSSNGFGHYINETYLTCMYTSTGRIVQSLDQNGYYKWTKSSSYLKLRPYYPTFGSSPTLMDSSNRQLYRNPYNAADCNLYLYPNATGPVTSFYVNGYCEAL